MTERDDEIRGLLDRPRNKGGRPKKASTVDPITGITVTPMRQRHLENTTGSPPYADKETRERLALDSSELLLKEAGADADPEYKHLLLVRLVQQGVSPTKAATMVGFASRMQGNRVMDRYRKNPRFRKKVDELSDRMRTAYIDSKVAQLPILSEIESAALQEYQADPMLAVNKPKMLRDLRIVAGVQTPEGIINQPGINIQHLQNLQVLFQGALGPGNAAIEAEVVTVEDGKDKQA